MKQSRSQDWRSSLVHSDKMSILLRNLGAAERPRRSGGDFGVPSEGIFLTLTTSGLAAFGLLKSSVECATDHAVLSCGRDAGDVDMSTTAADDHEESDQCVDENANLGGQAPLACVERVIVDEVSPASADSRSDLPWRSPSAR